MKETQNIECKEVQSLCIQTVSDKALESSWVVANRNMNRERQLSGPNSYEKDLRFDLSAFLQSRRKLRWLDLCCGTGKALIQASTRFGDRLECHGVDMVDSFAAIPQGARVTFHVASLHSWRCKGQYDLITSVHGLHYIGDKLGLLERVSRWLTEDGLFLGHLDLANVSHEQHQAFGAVLGKTFKRLGIRYNTRTKILCFHGNRPLTFNYAYVGADTTAGPNYTGQDAVRSIYSNQLSSGRYLNCRRDSRNAIWGYNKQVKMEEEVKDKKAVTESSTNKRRIMFSLKKLHEEFIVNGKLGFIGEEFFIAIAPPEEGWSESEMVTEAIRFRKESNRTNMIEMVFHINECRSQLLAFSKELILMEQFDAGKVDLSTFKTVVIRSLHESLLIKAANVNAGLLFLGNQLEQHGLRVDIGNLLKKDYNATNEETACLNSPVFDTLYDIIRKLCFQEGMIRVYSDETSFSVEDTNRDAISYGLPDNLLRGRGLINSVPFFLFLLLAQSKVLDVICKYYVIKEYGKESYLSASQSLQKDIIEGKCADRAEYISLLSGIYKKYFETDSPETGQ